LTALAANRYPRLSTAAAEDNIARAGLRRIDPG
jgi:hypothetical protein